MVGQIECFMTRKAGRRLARRENRLDLAVAQGDGMVFEYRARRLDGNDPARAEEERCCRYLGVPWISTTTRRFGARHWISALRSFWSGQDFSGRVLPKPKVSIVSVLAPFDTK